MSENLLEFINHLKTDRRIKSYDEAATKQAVILRLLTILGWDVYNIEEVCPEYSVGGKLVDYSLRIENANKVFLEIKRIGEDLEKHQEQLLGYSFQEGVKLASLTNGLTWWFYLPLHEGSWEQRKFFTIDTLQQESNDVASRFIDFLSKENVDNGKAIENAEKVYRGQQKQNILRKTLPKAWNKIITESDELLIEMINETTEKLCGYKTDDESIAQFILKHQGQFIISGDYQPKATSIPKRRQIISQESKGYAGRSITGFCFRNTRYEVKTWKGLLVKLSEILYNTHGDEFQKALSLKGRKRTYFVHDKNRLNSPAKVGNSNIFVETNLSANSIKQLCDKLLSIFGYADSDLKIETS